MTANNQWMLIKFQALYQTLMGVSYNPLTNYVGSVLSYFHFIWGNRSFVGSTHSELSQLVSHVAGIWTQDYLTDSSLYPWTPHFVSCYKGAETAWGQRGGVSGHGRFVSTKETGFICSFTHPVSCVFLSGDFSSSPPAPASQCVRTAWRVNLLEVATIIVVDICVTLGLLLLVYYWSKSRKAKATPMAEREQVLAAGPGVRSRRRCPPRGMSDGPGQDSFSRTVMVWPRSWHRMSHLRLLRNHGMPRLRSQNDKNCVGSLEMGWKKGKEK